MFQLLNETTKGKARAGLITTGNGTIETPIFMPVGTAGAVKAIDCHTLVNKIQAPIILGNTYHLYQRPGNDVMAKANGLHRFMNWQGALLTDSGGYQIYSLSDIRKLEDDGVIFKSHIDGSHQKFTPENVVETQRVIGSDIMMVLDECPPYPATEQYVEKSLKLTHKWAQSSICAFRNSTPRYAHPQYIFGITQGGTYQHLRKTSIEVLSELDFDGMAIGGLSVGEPPEVMYEIADFSTNYLPKEKPRYLMGVGTPADILHCIARGIDMFDCVMPTRNARNGMLFTKNGIINIKNAKWKQHFSSADSDFKSDLCQDHSMAYMHHLFKANEILGLQLASAHNLEFYLWLVKQARKQIIDGTFDHWYPKMVENVKQRI